MTMSTLGSTFALIVLCTYSPATELAPPRPVTDGRLVGQGAGRRINDADAHLINASAMGPVRLGMVLDDARRALPAASFSRTSDGDGAALVEIRFGKDEFLTVWADEDDPEDPIDWSKRIVSIEDFSGAFHTSEGIHRGSLVTEAARFFGPVLDIVKSEIESREYVTFARQPGGLRFRVDDTGIFNPGSRRTTRFEPGAKIWSIAISSHR